MLNLTKKEVEAIVAPHRFTKRETLTWDALYSAIESLPDDTKTRLEEASKAKELLSASKKRKTRCDKEQERTTKRQNTYSSAGDDEFMQPVTSEEVKSCFRLFRDATSNAALRRQICVVCGRKLMWNEGTVQQLDDIPHKHHLQPAIPHPAHQLWNGLLLEMCAIHRDEHLKSVGFVCKDCNKSLRDNKLPPLSLANDLWTGPTPFELRALTISEQLLIARHHPRCFIFKFFSRQGYGGDPDKLQLGIAGNVTLYELPTEGIVKMVEGQMLPSPCGILASLISVTFVGSRKLPRDWLRHTFRVRRKMVARALRWLKQNNALYHDITIDEAAIERLPEDGVLEEISELALHNRCDFTASKEAEGYAGEPLMSNEMMDDGDDVEHNDSGERVIPLHFNAVTDTSAMKVSHSELMDEAMSNSTGDEPGYAIRYSRQPISTFGEVKEGFLPPPRNPLMGAYPLLWPYGIGGIEDNDNNPRRRVKLSFAAHVKWCLKYHDQRFARHHSFPFVAFGIEQRRSALRSAKLQMNQTDFERDLTSLNTITLSDLRAAEQEEQQGKMVSNPKVRKLRKHVFAASGRVMGSNNCRASYRNEIWGTCLRLGPPSLWVTINPADVHDPIMQVFAGENIDMDRFLATAGPDKDARARNVASNPFAAASYFHFIIKTMLECLFGVKKTKYRVESQRGIFGRVSAYHGVIEAQGRGSLHWHVFFWLHGCPNAAEIEARLRSPEFRQTIADFIKSCIKADVEGLDDSTVKDIPKEHEQAYSRPPNPDSTNWQHQFSEREKKLVRSVQYHECNFSCMVPRHGRMVCKRRAPWPLSDVDRISEDGVVSVRRRCGFICSYSPAILVAMGCNNNVQLLMGGKQTKDAMWYLTDYTTKKQKKGFNTSALLANAFLYHQKDTAYLDDLRSRNRLFVFRCGNTLNCQMELSGQQVMSYLLGLGDVIRSHHYIPVCWAPLGRFLRTNLPELSGQSLDNAEIEDNVNVTLTFKESGTLSSRSAISDYIYRPPCFEDLGFLDFCVNTYDIPLSSREAERLNDGVSKRRGRQPNQRGRYLAQHEKSATYTRILRDEHHNCLPSIVGPWFPRPDSEGYDYDYYCASMLAILRPWRKVDDLKATGQSWHAALQELITSDPGPHRSDSGWRGKTFKVVDVLSAVAFYYDSKNLASLRREEQSNPRADVPKGMDHDASDRDDEDVEETEGQQGTEQSENAKTIQGFGVGVEWNCKTDADLQAYQLTQIPHRELAHALEAVNIAKCHKILNLCSTWMTSNVQVARATAEDENDLARWAIQMEHEVAKINDNSRPLTNDIQRDREGDGEGDVAIFIVREDETAGDVEVVGALLDTDSIAVEEALSGLNVADLNTEQRRAFEIISKHLDDTLNGRNPPQLLMILYGEGGTGKSRVIQSVTQEFARRGVAPMLCKGAFTGVAASLIDGKTLHVLAGIPLHGDR